MNQSSKKRYYQIVILIIVAGCIYPLVFLRSSFQQPILEAFNISVSQLDQLYLILGFLFIIGYLPSGWLADRFNSKKLIALSLCMTSVTGFYFATIPDSDKLWLIFGLLGFLQFLHFGLL